jgi:hypothetical protein
MRPLNRAGALSAGCGRERPVLIMRIDLDRLLKLRLVVARVGEMDLAKWWYTSGQLGPLGASVLRRGFPRTHHFAQARSVFAVASQRCREVYDAPRSVTLWNLPADLEDEFELAWERWIDHAARWSPFFEELHSCTSDLELELLRFGLVTEAHTAAVGRLRRSAELRAVQLPGEFTGSDDDISMLALAFAKGDGGRLALPHQSWGGTA